MGRGLKIGCGAVLALLLACAGIGLLGAILGGGGSAGARQAGATMTLPPNGAASAKNWTIRVVNTRRAGRTLKWSDYNTIEAAGTFLVVRVEVENTGRENFGLNTWDFELRDADGVTYKHCDQFGATLHSEYVGGKRLGERVPPGVLVTYYLVYDINPAARGLQLVFTQGGRPVFTLGQ